MGSDPTDPARFSALLEKLKIDEKQLGEQRVKHQLRAGTEEAVRQGVFGVPSFVVDGEVFWGADSIGFLQAFLDDSSLFKREEMQRLERLPIGAARRA
jgi:2-hydroxychromene-2-carboxylate isomerase